MWCNPLSHGWVRFHFAVFGYTVFPVCGRWDVFQSKNRGRGLTQHYWKDTLHAGVLKVIRSLLPDSCSAVFPHELWTVLAQSGQGIVRSLHIAHSGTENTRFGSREAAAWVDCAWDRTRHVAHLAWVLQTMPTLFSHQCCVTLSTVSGSLQVWDLLNPYLSLWDICCVPAFIAIRYYLGFQGVLENILLNIYFYICRFIATFPESSYPAASINQIKKKNQEILQSVPKSHHVFIFSWKNKHMMIQTNLLRAACNK